MPTRPGEANLVGMTAAIVEGALAGTYGAAAMTILRMAARRMGLIDRPVPHAIVDSLVGRSRKHRDAARRQVLLSEWLHLGYGAAWGALYGMLSGDSNRWVRRGLALAGAQWAVAKTARLPGFTPSKRKTPEHAAAKWVNVATHLVHGIATTLTASELAREERERTRGSPGERVG